MIETAMATKTKYWLATDESGVCWTGTAHSGQCVATGLSKLVWFDTIEELTTEVQKHAAILPLKSSGEFIDEQYYNDKGTVYRHEEKE